MEKVARALFDRHGSSWQSLVDAITHHHWDELPVTHRKIPFELFTSLVSCLLSRSGVPQWDVFFALYQRVCVKVDEGESALRSMFGGEAESGAETVFLWAAAKKKCRYELIHVKQRRSILIWKEGDAADHLLVLCSGGATFSDSAGGRFARGDVLGRADLLAQREKREHSLFADPTLSEDEQPVLGLRVAHEVIRSLVYTDKDLSRAFTHPRPQVHPEEGARMCILVHLACAEEDSGRQLVDQLADSFSWWGQQVARLYPEAQETLAETRLRVERALQLHCIVLLVDMHGVEDYAHRELLVSDRVDARADSPNSTLVMVHRDDTPRFMRHSTRTIHVRLQVAGDVRRLCRYLRDYSVAVVLGGHAEGYGSTAYIGALLGFQQAGVPVDVVSGCFSGAAVAAMYGLGMSGHRMASRLHQMDPARSFYDGVLDAVFYWLRPSLRSSQRCRSRIANTFTHKQSDYRFTMGDMGLSQLRLVSLDLHTLAPYYMTQGDCASAVARAMFHPASGVDPMPQCPSAKVSLGVRVVFPDSNDAHSRELAAAALSHTEFPALSDWIDVDMRGVDSGVEAARRGYRAAMHLVQQLSAEELASMGEPQVEMPEHEPDFAWATPPKRSIVKKVLSIGTLLTVTVLLYLVIGKRAENARMMRLKAIAPVKTHYVIDE